VGIPKAVSDLHRHRSRRVVIADEIRSLAISQRLLGTKEIVLTHHTDCGMLTFTDDEFKEGVRKETRLKPERYSCL
jgi:carbonic anhydrase